MAALSAGGWTSIRFHWSFVIGHLSLVIRPKQVRPSRANSGEVAIHPMIVCLATDNRLLTTEIPGQDNS